MSKAVFELNSGSNLCKAGQMKLQSLNGSVGSSRNKEAYVDYSTIDNTTCFCVKHNKE